VSFVSTYFEYDNISSYEMGVRLIQINPGMINSSFGYDRSPITEKIKGRDKEFLFGVDTNVHKFSIAITTLDNKPWTKELKMRVAKWLFQTQYKPFVSGDSLDIIYYCMADGHADRYDTSTGHGYIAVDFICNSPYAFSPTYIDVYSYDTFPTETIALNNYSNVNKYFYPEVEITMIDDTDVIITNLTNGGEQFTFSELEVGEVVYINNQSKQIISSLPNTYRLNNFNKKWLRLVEGVNRLKITGKVRVVFKSSFPIIL